MVRQFATLALLVAPLSLFAQEHWVATWAASPQLVRPPAAPAAPPARAQGAAPAPAGPPPIASFSDQTIRMTVRTSLGGSRFRVQFSNTYGTAPLALGAAHIALHGQESAIVAGSDRTLTFNGKPAISIPPGALVLSDPVDLQVPNLADLAISIYIPGESGLPTMHATGLHTTYITKGNATAAATLSDTTTRASWYFLSAVDVAAPPDAATIVTFGDSITDGATSTVDTNSSWPSFLAQRLLANAATAHVAVVNEGISGNRLLHDGAGVNSLARFDSDVLAQPGVKWVTVLLGINDIGFGMRQPSEAVPAEQIIGALRQLVDRAHTRGLKVIGCTLTPYEGAAYYSEAGEPERLAVNQWIRTSGVYDAVVDFEAVVKDKANPKQIRPDFNIRDHLHPNDAGYKAMADSIDLGLFAPTTGLASPTNLTVTVTH
ncbi:MAG TPA: SGNH/GDSL hydrolase family protein [Bryobacteraceae bacterium]|nr:SGNH/GDSL hydrolase family protein [Bryobacteraceae bacterium]